MNREIPYINLDNFLNEEFKDSEYVLTSPLSLKACSNLNVKPYELLRNQDEKLEQVRETWYRLKEAAMIKEGEGDIEVYGTRIDNKGGHNVSKSRIGSNESSNIQRNISAVHSAKCSRPNSHQIKRKSTPTTAHSSSNRDSKLIREFEVQVRRSHLKDQERQKQKELAMKIAVRQERAERNRQNLKQTETWEIIDRRRLAEKRSSSVIERKKQLENEIDEYYKELAKFRHLTLQTAEEKATERLLMDTRRISDERQHKEAQFISNRQMLEEENHSRYRDLQQKINECDHQTTLHEQQKLERILESRILAGEAEKMRSEIRQKFGLDSFDKKAEQAKLVNYIMSKS